MKLLIAGGSEEAVCGTRDYARTLAEPLRLAGADVRTVWWERGAQSLASWSEELERALADTDVTLWQYSVFTYGRRGLPTLVPRVLRTLCATGVPLVTVLHELAFPWGVNGVRGAVHAATHRLALVPVLRASAGVVVTTEDRRDWLASRTWLPHRPATFLPVVSNAGRSDGTIRSDGLRIGVFGFRRVPVPVDLLVGSVARLPGAELVLIGAPGPDAPEAEAWRRAAAAVGRPDLLSFTGVLEADRLAGELATVDVMLFADPVGPTSRRGTLAAALAHAKPIVALRGPQTWERLVREHALVLADQTVESLGRALRELADPAAREAQARRARAFHDNHLATDIVARSLLSFAGEAAR